MTFFARNAAVALFSGLPPAVSPPARLPPLDTLGVARPAGDLPLSRLFLFLLELFLFLLESPAWDPAVFFA